MKSLDFPHTARLSPLEAAILLVIFGMMFVPMPRCKPRRSYSPYDQTMWALTGQYQLGWAIMAFAVDHHGFPGQRPLAHFSVKAERLAKAHGERLWTVEPGGSGIEGITTPTVYLASLPPDPFAPEDGMPFAYYTDGTGWILFSPGPDRVYDIVPQEDYDGRQKKPGTRLVLLTYDPTNGLKSRGDIWRSRQWGTW